jgi:uncharacterized protein YcbK (DUF882 family)
MRCAPAAIAFAVWLGVIIHPVSSEAPAEGDRHPIAAIQPAAPPSAPVVSWTRTLPVLTIHDANSMKTGDVRLYGEDGAISEDAARTFDRIVDDGKHGAPRPLNRRLLALVVKAAAHFKATHISVVSSYRDSKRSGSRHRTGEALDFVLDGVPPGQLAQHLRSYGRVGVGIYTHPRTQFVHLDVRDESYHWLDASPPGHTWREKGITDGQAVARDAAWRPEQDLPECANPGRAHFADR